MRRILLASCIALLPGLALAQSASPPPPGGADSAMMGAPDGGPDAGPGPGPDGAPGGGGMMGGWGGKGGHHRMDPGAFLMSFYAANTTHDGHLTLAQAKAGGLTPVADNFTAIDVKKRGYVTFYDIEAWRLDDMAKHLETRADALRAKD